MYFNDATTLLSSVAVLANAACPVATHTVAHIANAHSAAQILFNPVR